MGAADVSSASAAVAGLVNLVEFPDEMIEEPEQFHPMHGRREGRGRDDQIRDSESVHRAGHLARFTTYFRWRASAICCSFA